MSSSGSFVAAWLILAGFVAPTRAQSQAAPRAEEGTPNATRSLETTHLPPAPPEFKGEINLNAAQSKPAWPARVVPPKSAPNVLLIMTDDVGFGAPSTFGGPVPTPTLDRMAKAGLRYNMFHSTALCSPTRAALITGRNHHSVHTGNIMEASTGFPGYNSLMGKETATIAEILRQNGYATSWFGKNHNVPNWLASQVGPFDLWPNALGFEYFYGFVGGDTSQWQPNLFRNNTPIQPYLGKPGWNLTTAMADEARGWLKQLNEISPERPFFLYYVPGGTHAPHHPTPEWIAKFKGKFDLGWNALRDQTFQRQKELGVIPTSAQLTPWPENLPKWETLSPTEKKLYAHQAEVYAAYLAYTDFEIGRVIQAVDDMGKLDNTLVIYISGDNGGSAEGSTKGTPNEVAVFNGVVLPPEEQLKFYDVWGSDKTYPHFSVAWSWALDTPFKWTKQVASHFGGTRQGMTVVWPKRIKDAGGLRSQFHHVIDVVPTILEACGIKHPVDVNGVPQRPIEGVSMVYTFDKKNAHVPSTHLTQYFEMMGNRALYHDGWVASTTPIQPPWEISKTPPADVANAYNWELYNLNADFSQANDLASKNPDKLRSMKELFLIEASKFEVLPLDNSIAARLAAPRPNLTNGRTVFNYTGELANLPHGGAPSILNTSFSITADLEIPKGGAEGMILTQGGRFGGYGLYLAQGKPTFLYNALDVVRTRWASDSALSPGRHTVVFDFKYDGGGLGKGGTGNLRVDGKEVASKRIDKTVPLIWQWDETFDVGIDTGTPVADQDYKVPFKFTGKLNKVTLELKPVPMKPEDRRAVLEKGNRNNSASE